MAVCARAILQSDGSYLLGIDPSVTDSATCAYVVETGSESLLFSLAAMTTDDALVISSAVAAIWAAAWGLRQVRISITQFFNEGSQDE